jgi:cytochrome c
MLKQILIITKIIIMVLLSGQIHAEEVKIDVPFELLELIGDVEYGEYLASACTTCHKANGESGRIPNIHGKSMGELMTALYGYREKIKPNPVMQMQAGRLSNEEIAALAAYFENLTWEE